MSTWHVHALKYADRNARTRADSFIFDDNHDTPHAMDYFIWVLRRGSEVILVDTGYDQEEAERTPRSICKRLKWPSPPDLACATIPSVCLLRRTIFARLSNVSIPVAASFTTVMARLLRGSQYIALVAIRAVCKPFAYVPRQAGFASPQTPRISTKILRPENRSQLSSICKTCSTGLNASIN